MRPLHRWKSFWFGVIMLGFLGWAWVRSMSHRDSVDLWIGANSWGFHSVGGQVEIERVRLPSSLGWISRFQVDSDDGHGFGQEWFPPAVTHVRVGSDWIFWTAAWWLLVLLFLVPWISFLVLRRRRLKGSAERCAEP